MIGGVKASTPGSRDEKSSEGGLMQASWPYNYNYNYNYKIFYSQKDSLGTWENIQTIQYNINNIEKQSKQTCHDYTLIRIQNIILIYSYNFE